MIKEKQTELKQKAEKKRPVKNIWLKWKSLKKRWKFLIIIVLLIIVGSGWSKISSKKQMQANREVITVVRENIKKEAIRSGQVELQGVVQVTPPISGVITELLVENGQTVTEGEELFKMKSDATQAELNQAWASYLTAKNNYEEAKNSSGVSEWNNFENAKSTMMAVEEEVKKFEELYPEKKNHQDKDYQELKLKESVARRNLDAATLTPSQISSKTQESKAIYQASLSSYNATKDGSYKSPIAGRIENIGVNEGEKVIAKVGDKDGTPLFLIVPDGKKTVSMQIGPSDAMTLQVGQMATVKNDYIKDATFAAQVVRVDKVGKTTSDKGLTYRAWLEVEDTNNKLLLGIPVEITLTTAEKEQVLVVPSEAVHESMITITDDKGTVIEERAVQTGLKANGKVEIISGVNEGEKVLVDKNEK